MEKLPVPHNRWDALLAALTLATSIWLVFQSPAPVDNSAPSWVHPDDPASKAYAYFCEVFGADDVYVVLLSSESPGALVDHLSRATGVLERAPIVEKVISAKTIFARQWKEVASLAVQNPDALDTLLSGPLNRKMSLLNLDDGKAVIFGFSSLSSRDDRKTLRDDLEAFRREAELQGVVARIAGNPLLNLELDLAGTNVETRSLPILVAICFILLLVFTRSLFTTLVTLAPAGLTVWATEGAFGLTGLSSNIVVSIAKPLLFVLILASTLHLIIAWQDALRSGVSRTVSPFWARQKKGKAVTFALLTTAIGFGSLALSSVPPIRNFGIMSAAGLAWGIAVLLWVLPFALMMLPPPKTHRESATAHAAVTLCRTGIRLGALFPAIALIVIVGGIGLALGLKADPHAIRYFDADHPLRTDHEAIEAEGLGLATMELLIKNDTQALTANVAQKLSEFTKDIENLPDVKAALDLSLLTREALYQQYGTDQLDVPAVPVESVLQSGGEDFDTFITSDNDLLRVAVLIGTLDADALQALRSKIVVAYRRHFKDTNVDGLTITGNYELLLRTQSGLLDTLQKSLLFTTLIMTVLFVVFLRSVRVALVALIPNLFPVCLNFLVMSLFDLPLDVGTSMTAAIALGIAVDDTLHFTLAWNPRAPNETARTTGHAIILSSVIIGVGFLSLITGDFAPTRNFGILCGVAMGSALVADLLILPPLLRWVSPSAQQPSKKGNQQ